MILPSEENMKVALRRTVAKLSALNRKQVKDASTEDFWLEWCIKGPREKKVRWELTDARGASIDLYDLVERCKRQLMGLHGKAYVHGDIHLRNVLLSDDRDPIFIDYATSGPGHPCYDLVQLDLSVCCGALRVLGPEEELVRLIRRMVVDGCGFEVSCRDYPCWFSSVCNRVVFQNVLNVRAECERVLSEYHGTMLDYWAMRVLVSANVLVWVYPQSIAARASICACADLIP